MGLCASSGRREREAERKRRIVMIGPKQNNLVTPSPVDGGFTVGASDRPAKSPPSPPLPSTVAPVDSDREDETFFDSQLYWESDCDDDFHSVRGDFTPSRGSTPIHHRFLAGSSPKAKEPLFTEQIPSSTPQRPSEERKKRLEELFGESLGGDKEFDDISKSAFGTPNYSSSVRGCAENSPIEQPKRERQCCFPVPKLLLSRHSFSEGKKSKPHT